MQNKAAFLHQFMEEIWNQKKAEELSKYIHPKYTVHLDTADPWEGKTLTHKEFITRLNYSFDSFPDLHFEITATIEEEHCVAINWVLTGTHLGFIGDLPPTQKLIRTPGITIYHFTDDLISGHTQVFDRTVVAQQLGFMG